MATLVFALVEHRACSGLFTVDATKQCNRNRILFTAFVHNCEVGRFPLLLSGSVSVF